MLSNLLQRSARLGASRRCSTTTTALPVRPVRPTSITAQERATIRAARKERATAALRQAQGGGGAAAQAAGSSSSTTAKSSRLLPATSMNPKYARYWWYLGLGMPTLLITWAIYDETSPPAQLAQAVGLAGLIGDYTSHISKPMYDKLLPDWADVSVAASCIERGRKKTSNSVTSCCFWISFCMT